MSAVGPMRMQRGPLHFFFAFFFLVWYGIGMLYERCGSYEHAEEAFTGVLKVKIYV
jgi:hypothetical protein